VKSWVKRRVRRIAVVVAAALALAVLVDLKPAPLQALRRRAQLADMQVQLERLPLPDGSRLIATSEASYPVSMRYFGVAGQPRAVCDAMYEAARSIGEPERYAGDAGGSCGFHMPVASGWRAWLALVPEYELRAFAMLDGAATKPTDEFCRRELAEEPPLAERIGPCWVRDGESYVYYMLYGVDTITP